jgi:hypothetical protein
MVVKPPSPSIQSMTPLSGNEAPDLITQLIQAAVDI